MIGSYTVESSGEFSSPVPTYEPTGTRERTISSKTEREKLIVGLFVFIASLALGSSWGIAIYYVAALG
jgi:hypothetical protein